MVEIDIMVDDDDDMMITTWNRAWQNVRYHQMSVQIKVANLLHFGHQVLVPIF